MPQKTINQISTIIASDLKRETDEPFKRIIGARVDFWRSTLISRSLEKHPQQRNFFTQTLWLPMECHSPIPCPTPMVLCNIMRSVDKVPAPMRFGDTIFDYVGSIDGKNAFGLAIAGTSDIMQEGKYTGRKTFYEWTNRRISITNKTINFVDKPLPMIRVDAVFDNPYDVWKYNCKTDICDFWDEPYPATNDIIQQIIQYILQIDYGKDKDKNVSNPPEVEVNPAVPRNN